MNNAQMADYLCLFEGSRSVQVVWRNIRLTEHAMDSVSAGKACRTFIRIIPELGVPRIDSYSQLLANTHRNYKALEYETRSLLIRFYTGCPIAKR